MGAANLSPDDLRAEIRKTKALTTKPFAVDLLAPLPQMIVPYLPVLYDEGVKIFVAGLAVPDRHVPEMKAHGLKIMVMCGKVKHAVRAESAGATSSRRRAPRPVDTRARSGRSRSSLRSSTR
jgi:enoyl-[acyl-carrier protein] reductase II